MESKFFYVYTLFSFKDRKFYTGYTEDWEARVQEHLKGRVRATKNRFPLVLIHYEAFRSKKDAQARERFLKSGFGRGELKKALKNDLNRLNYKHLY